MNTWPHLCFPVTENHPALTAPLLTPQVAQPQTRTSNGLYLCHTRKGLEVRHLEKVQAASFQLQEALTPAYFGVFSKEEVYLNLRVKITSMR